MKKLIKLTESDLHRIVENSIKSVLNELDDRTIAGYQQGRYSQVKGERDYSDAMKRRSMRDLVYNRKYPARYNNPAKTPKEVADRYAVRGYQKAKDLYSVDAVNDKNDSSKKGRDYSTYKNGKWKFDPKKFN